MRKVLAVMLIAALLTHVFTVAAYASNPHGAGQGRTDSVNINDYSTSNWDRINYNYKFTTGPNTKATFGVPTQTDAVSNNPMQNNVRRNKDAAHLPPGYSIYSGAIPTNPSSLFHMADGTASANNNTYNGAATVNFYGDTTGVLPTTSVMQAPTAIGSTSNISVSQIPSNTLFTQPTYYGDGSIGFLSIPAINTYVPVYEGETQANMKLGATHFEHTSAWDGNIGLAGHNRGAADYFKGVKDLKIGDKITYETMYGTRTYEVYFKQMISDTDFTHLGWSPNNIISLITCVIDTPTMRWIVQAREVL